MHNPVCPVCGVGLDSHYLVQVVCAQLESEQDDVDRLQRAIGHALKLVDVATETWGQEGWTRTLRDVLAKVYRESPPPC